MIRPLGPHDRDWVAAFVRERWGEERILSRGRVHVVPHLPGVVAESGGRRLGLATYAVEGDGCELVTIDSVEEGRGVGGALLEAVCAEARRAGCRRLWLITTNDNLAALRFYQRRGLRLVALHRDAVTRARERKPAIPLVGEHGIPIRDELELELLLDGPAG